MKKGSVPFLTPLNIHKAVKNSLPFILTFKLVP